MFVCCAPKKRKKRRKEKENAFLLLFVCLQPNAFGKIDVQRVFKFFFYFGHDATSVSASRTFLAD